MGFGRHAAVMGGLGEFHVQFNWERHAHYRDDCAFCRLQRKRWNEADRTGVEIALAGIKVIVGLIFVVWSFAVIFPIAVFFAIGWVWKILTERGRDGRE